MAVQVNANPTATSISGHFSATNARIAFFLPPIMTGRTMAASRQRNNRHLLSVIGDKSANIRNHLYAAFVYAPEMEGISRLNGPGQALARSLRRVPPSWRFGPIDYSGGGIRSGTASVRLPRSAIQASIRSSRYPRGPSDWMIVRATSNRAATSSSDRAGVDNNLCCKSATRHTRLATAPAPGSCSACCATFSSCLRREIGPSSAFCLSIWVVLFPIRCPAP